MGLGVWAQPLGPGPRGRSEPGGATQPSPFPTPRPAGRKVARRRAVPLWRWRRWRAAARRPAGPTAGPAPAQSPPDPRSLWTLHSTRRSRQSDRAHAEQHDSARRLVACPATPSPSLTATRLAPPARIGYPRRPALDDVADPGPGGPTPSAGRRSAGRPRQVSGAARTATTTKACRVIAYTCRERTAMLIGRRRRSRAAVIGSRPRGMCAGSRWCRTAMTSAARPGRLCPGCWVSAPRRDLDRHHRHHHVEEVAPSRFICHLSGSACSFM